MARARAGRNRKVAARRRLSSAHRRYRQAWAEYERLVDDGASRAELHHARHGALDAHNDVVAARWALQNLEQTRAGRRAS